MSRRWLLAMVLAFVVLVAMSAVAVGHRVHEQGGHHMLWVIAFLVAFGGTLYSGARAILTRNRERTAWLWTTGAMAWLMVGIGFITWSALTYVVKS